MWLRASLRRLLTWYVMLQPVPMALAQARAHGVHDDAYLMLLAGGALAAFSGDRLVERDRRWLRETSAWQQALLVLLSLAGGAAVIGSLLMLGERAWMGLVLIILGLARYGLRHLPGGKSLADGSIWCVALVALPLADPLLSLSAWLLFAAACLQCDITDRARDAQRRIRSLPVVLGEAPSRALAGVALLLAAALYVWQGLPLLAGGALLLVAITVRPRLLRDHLLAPLTVDGILLLSAVAQWWVGHWR